MIVYLDASVISAIALRDDRWEDAVRSNAMFDTIAYSDLGFGELVSSIAIRARTLRQGDDLVRDILADIAPLIAAWKRYPIKRRDVADATDLVARVTLNLRLPDAIHVVVARRIGATLITNDRQQYRAALALGMPAINPLEPSPS